MYNFYVINNSYNTFYFILNLFSFIVLYSNHCIFNYNNFLIIY